VILDAGVLIAFDRNDARARQVVEALQRQGVGLRATEPVVAQVWRDGARQVRLARLLQQASIHPFGDGRAVGTLLRGAGTADVVDAHLVQVASELGDAIITGDPDDLRRIAAVVGDAAPIIYAWP
jgi:hypothetical protein